MVPTPRPRYSTVTVEQRSSGKRRERLEAHGDADYPTLIDRQQNLFSRRRGQSIDEILADVVWKAATGDVRQPSILVENPDEPIAMSRHSKIRMNYRNRHPSPLLRHESGNCNRASLTRSAAFVQPDNHRLQPVDVAMSWSLMWGLHSSLSVFCQPTAARRLKNVPIRPMSVRCCLPDGSHRLGDHRQLGVPSAEDSDTF
jgi:hypothetical protein